MACGGDRRDQIAGSPGKVRSRRAGDTSESWSPATPPARRAGDETRAPDTLVEAAFSRDCGRGFDSRRLHFSDVAQAPAAREAVGALGLSASVSRSKRCAACSISPSVWCFAVGVVRCPQGMHLVTAVHARRHRTLTRNPCAASDPPGLLGRSRFVFRPRSWNPPQCTQGISNACGNDALVAGAVVVEVAASLAG